MHRFTRRGVDPAPLAEHGLVNELLNRLSNAAGPATTNVSGPGMYLYQKGFFILLHC